MTPTPPPAAGDTPSPGGERAPAPLVTCDTCGRDVPGRPDGQPYRHLRIDWPRLDAERANRRARGMPPQGWAPPRVACPNGDAPIRP